MIREDLVVNMFDVTYGPKSYGLVCREGHSVFIRNYHRELKNGKGLTYWLAYARCIGTDLNRTPALADLIKLEGEDESS